MDILITQEIALHQYETRQNKAKVSQLLHRSFKEVGRSGNDYNQNTIDKLSAEQPGEETIHSQNYRCRQLAPFVQLLTYKTAAINKHGVPGRFAKRSSIWSLSGNQWQMQYHQATPCKPFALE